MNKMASYSPATLQEVGSVDVTSVEEIPALIARSKEAQEGWSRTTPGEREKLFDNLTKLIADESEDIGLIVHKETGKPKAEAVNMESYVSASFSKYCQIWLKNFKFEKKVDLKPVKGLLSALGRSSKLIYKPLGVTVSISPNNFPFCIPFTEAATAVAAGNSIIIKPSPDTPLCGNAIASLFERAGFPKDLVMCLHGPMVGETLTSSKGINRIMFTGSTKTGKSVMRSAADNLVPVSLELGGCDPVLVLKDADIDRALDCCVWGAFTGAGQVCVGFQRILVQNSLYDEFSRRFVEKTKALKVGADWNDPEISVGPVINQAAIDCLERDVAAAVAAGGKVMCGGKRMDRVGYFFEPTVVLDVPTDSEVFNKEVFGPYVTISPFETEDEAVRIANSSDYALGGSVWSKNVKHAQCIARRLDSGIVDVNNGMYNYGMPTTPWGGCKSSGFGKSHGDEGFLSVMYVQHVHTDSERFEFDPWWMPFSKESTQVQVDMTKGFFGTKRRVLSIFARAMPLLKRKN